MDAPIDIVSTGPDRKEHHCAAQPLLGLNKNKVIAFEYLVCE